MVVAIVLTWMANMLGWTIALLKRWRSIGAEVSFRFGEAPERAQLMQEYIGRVVGERNIASSCKCLTLIFAQPIPRIATGEAFAKVIAAPHFRSDTPYRLLIGTLTVRMYPVDDGRETTVVPMIAIGELRLRKKGAQQSA